MPTIMQLHETATYLLLSLSNSSFLDEVKSMHGSSFMILSPSSRWNNPYTMSHGSGLTVSLEPRYLWIIQFISLPNPCPVVLWVSKHTFITLPYNGEHMAKAGTNGSQCGSALSLAGAFGMLLGLWPCRLEMQAALFVPDEPRVHGFYWIILAQRTCGPFSISDRVPYLVPLWHRFERQDA